MGIGHSFVSIFFHRSFRDLIVCAQHEKKSWKLYHPLTKTARVSQREEHKMKNKMKFHALGLFAQRRNIYTYNAQRTHIGITMCNHIINIKSFGFDVDERGAGSVSSVSVILLRIPVSITINWMKSFIRRDAMWKKLLKYLCVKLSVFSCLSLPLLHLLLSFNDVIPSPCTDFHRLNQITIHLLNCDIIAFPKWRIKNVNCWVRAAIQPDVQVRSLPFIYRCRTLSSAFFHHCFDCRAPDWREIHFRIFICFSLRSTYLKLGAHISVALILMRLRKYVRNKYFKLSRKSKTVNGMMYQRQLPFPIVSSLLVCRSRCRNFQL